MDIQIIMKDESNITNNSMEKIEVDLCRRKHEAFCHLCQKRVGLLTEMVAAHKFQTNINEIEKLIARRAIHRIHNSKGAEMICENSLRAVERCFRISRTVKIKPIEAK